MDCPRCRIGDFTRTRRPDGIKHRPTEPTPTDDMLEEWVMDSVCEATDGCTVEPDGQCPHGHTSWLRIMGVC